MSRAAFASLVLVLAAAPARIEAACTASSTTCCVTYDPLTGNSVSAANAVATTYSQATQCCITSGTKIYLANSGDSKVSLNGAPVSYNSCLVCVPTTSPTTYTLSSAYIACNANTAINGGPTTLGSTPGVCSPGTGLSTSFIYSAASSTCVASCAISNGGVITTYSPNAANPAEPSCQSCNVLSNLFGWSTGSDGTFCSADGVLTSSASPGTGTCAVGDNANSNTVSGKPCAFVCETGACSQKCYISPDGNAAAQVFDDGDVNPNNACEVCDAISAPFAWTAKPLNTVCTGSPTANGHNYCGGTSDAGVCKWDCLIGGSNYLSGNTNPTSDCQTCAPATSKTTWTPKSEFSACATGGNNYCDATGTCTYDCFVGGFGYNSGDANPSNECEVCTPGTSTTAFSDVTDGQSCGAAGCTCTAGVCGSCPVVSTTCWYPDPKSPKSPGSVKTPDERRMLSSPKSPKEGQCLPCDPVCFIDTPKSPGSPDSFGRDRLLQKRELDHKKNCKLCNAEQTGPYTPKSPDSPPKPPSPPKLPRVRRPDTPDRGAAKGKQAKQRAGKRGGPELSHSGAAAPKERVAPAGFRNPNLRG